MSVEEWADGTRRWKAIACEASENVPRRSSGYHQNLGEVLERRGYHEPRRGEHSFGYGVGPKKVRQAGGSCYGEWDSSTAR